MCRLVCFYGCLCLGVACLLCVVVFLSMLVGWCGSYGGLWSISFVVIVVCIFSCVWVLILLCMLDLLDFIVSCGCYAVLVWVNVSDSLCCLVACWFRMRFAYDFCG